MTEWPRGASGGFVIDSPKRATRSCRRRGMLRAVRLSALSCGGRYRRVGSASERGSRGEQMVDAEVDSPSTPIPDEEDAAVADRCSD
jgi:hypothetical protein